MFEFLTQLLGRALLLAVALGLFALVLWLKMQAEHWYKREGYWAEHRHQERYARRMEKEARKKKPSP